MKNNKKSRKFHIIAAVCVIIIVSAFLLIFNSESPSSWGEGNVLYKKGNTVYIANLASGEKEVVLDTVKAPFGVTDEKMMDKILNTVFVSSDGTVVYSDSIDNKKEGFDIYLKSKGEDVKLVDRDVREYIVSKSALQIAYLKSDENTLYFNNNGAKTQIAENVQTVTLSENGDRLIYYTNSKELYALELTDNQAYEPELIASDVNLELLTEKADKVYFLKENDLYLWTWDKEAELIKNDVVKLVAAGECGDICYVTKREERLSYYELIKKDESLLNSLTEDYLKYLKENEKTFTYYSLYYYYKGEEVTVSEHYFYPEYESGRKAGDYVREEINELKVSYKNVKLYNDSLEVYQDEPLERIDKRLTVAFSGAGSFTGSVKAESTKKAEISKDKVSLLNGSEFSLKIAGGTYRNLYYRENKNGEWQLMDTLVGYLSATPSGEVWFLKGADGEAFELYSYYNGKRKYIENEIDIISQVSGKRKREFYEFVEGYGGRVSYTITDKEEYKDVYISLDLPYGMGICGNI